MTSLQKIGFEYQANLIGGLAGGALGAGITALGTKRTVGESDMSLSKRRRNNALTGGVAGAALGGVAPQIGSALSKLLPEPAAEPTNKDKILSALSPANHAVPASVVGAAGGGAAGYAGGRALSKMTGMTDIGANLKPGIETALEEIKALGTSNPKRVQELEALIAKARMASSKGTASVIRGSRLGKILGVVGGAAGAYYAPGLLTE